MSETNEPIIELAGVRRSYRMGDSILEVLRGIDWRVKRGEWACLLGASGSGKTTLLNLIGALEKPDAGMIRVAGTDLAGLSRRAAAKFRNRRIGFVFQAYHLLPELTILENVMLPARFAGGAGACRIAAGDGRTLRAAPPPAERTFRRRAAAGGDRPCAGQRAGTSTGG